jgi:AmiR/NasT family two-component response regulator
MSEFQQAELRDLSILIAHPHDQHGSALLRCLRRLGCRPNQTWPAPERLTEPVDVLFCAIDRQTRTLAASLVESPRSAVIGLVDGANAEALHLLATISPHAVLALPFDVGAVVASMIVARANFTFQRRLQSKIVKLEETLRSVRKVERAKAILMERRRIDESAAYELLRNQAMRKRVPIALVASVVIDSNEVLPNE